MEEIPPGVREWMAEIAKRPRTKQRALSCLVCGKAFTTRGRGRYCSGTCRSRAHRRKVAEAVRLGLGEPPVSDSITPTDLQ
jgi:hypothetical protein